ncbi:hypothetical protein NEMBOFW57_002655 [Staphylotrichum longicolle]|uniref:WD40 repeat-like protein n=1 Tax=Staphylotrichum longicolle TaxID=669026 RepID=A0AAD4I3V0_9PEZI|nr:hypothetical protein NEMBOFW57_002655 [Staphylotrichum longicolle]
MAQKSQAITRLQHSYALSPITALTFHEASPDRTLLLAGEDTWLKVYDVQTSRLLGQLSVFSSQPIHGIHVSSSSLSSSSSSSNDEIHVLIWGGHSVALLPPSSLRALLAGQTPPRPAESHAPDWIYDGILFPPSSTTQTASNTVAGALVTAHNEILPFSSSSLTTPDTENENENKPSPPPPLTFGALASPSRPILYSANLCLLSEGVLLVAGGTVFGEIIVWKYYYDADSWDREGRVLDEARETGFGGSGGGNSEAKRENEADKASGKNIWSSAVLNRGEREPLVATGGADGKIVVSGKIGGSGSSDTFEDLDLSLTCDEILQSLQNSAQPTASASQTKSKQTFQRYAFLSNTVMATTVSGRLFLATMGDPLVWEEAALPEAVVADLRGYNVIKSPARDTALLGSASGKVYLFQKGGEAHEISNLPEKVSDIILLGNSPSHASDGRPWSVIINILGLDHAILLHFDPSSNTTTIDPRKIRLPEHYIVTAAAFLNTTLILGSRTGSVTVYTDPDSGDFVPLTSRKDCKTKDAITSIVPIPGSNASSFLTTCRDGKCRIYTLPPADAPPRPNLQHEISPPLNTLEAAFFTIPSSAQGPDSKTELILHGFRGPNFLAYNDSTRAIIASISCGGAHRPFATVSCPHDPGQMRFVCSKARDLRVVSQSGEGERVLRSGGHGREIKAVSASSDGGLVATAAEDTSIRIWRHRHSDSGSPSKMDCLAILQGHSAGIQTLRFFSPPATNPSDPNAPLYLLSSAGSEELFLWRLSGLPSTTYDALAVVREAVWDDYTSPDRDLRVVDFDVVSCPATFVPSCCPQPGRDDEDETGTGFEAGAETPTAEQDKRENETENGGGEMLITMALSDSSIRVYHYSPPTSAQRNKFTPLAVGRYTGACPTQVRYLQVNERETETETEEVHVLTAFTDGHVAVWRAAPNNHQDNNNNNNNKHNNNNSGGEGPTTQLTLDLAVRVHQSSIKSLDLVKTQNRGWLVATGGDDNALGFLDLAWQGEEKEKAGGYAVRGRYRVRDAHAAAITGLSVAGVGGEEDGVTEVATVSNDQRVKLWRAERRAAGGLKVALLDNRYSSVADAGDLELIAPGKLMVGGVGMEMWDVSRGGIEESR